MTTIAVLIAVLGVLAGRGAGHAGASDTLTNVPVPSTGAYLGIFSALPGMTDSQSVDYREQEFGRTFDIDDHYYDWTDNFPSQLEKDDVAAGRFPEITWWGTDYASILNGSYDAMIRTRAEAIKAFGHPIFLRWAAEMNGDWFAWGGSANGDDPAGFVAAWRHIHDIFTDVGATNVSWVWCPNGESQPGGINPTSWNNWQNYYPGAAYVDWVGIDGYNWGDLFGPDEWQSEGDIMSPVYSDYASSKPIMLAETASTESGGDKAAWIADAAVWIKSHPDVKAFVWFDRTYTQADSTGIHPDWGLDTSPSALGAYAALVSDPYFSRATTGGSPSAGEGGTTGNGTSTGGGATTSNGTTTGGTTTGSSTTTGGKVHKPRKATTRARIARVQLLPSRHGRVLYVKVISPKRRVKIEIRLLNRKQHLIKRVGRKVKSNRHVEVKHLHIGKQVKRVRVRVLAA